MLRRRVTVLGLLFLMLVGGLLPAAAPAQAADDAVRVTPTPLVGSGVTRYTLTEPKVFWHAGVPSCAAWTTSSTCLP